MSTMAPPGSVPAPRTEVGTTGGVEAAVAPPRTLETGAEAARPRVRGLRLPLGDLIGIELTAFVVAVASSPVGRVPVVLLCLLWPVLLASAGAYRSRPVAGPFERARATLRAGAVFGLVCWVAALAAGARANQTEFLLLACGAVSTALTLRLVADTYVAGRRHRDGLTCRVVVAGHAADVRRTLVELGSARRSGLEVAAVCLSGGSAFDTDLPTSGLEDLAGVASAHGAAAVIALPCHELDPTTLRRIGWRLEESGVHLYVGTGLLDVARTRTTIAQLGGLRMLHITAAPRLGPAHAVKDVVERVASAFALLLLLPALVAIGVAIRLGSPGPAIFRQVRVGRGGREFTMYKFRTMRADAEDARELLVGHNESDAILFKIRRDPRITRLGGLLRRYSLDELPQLGNVLLGHMSLVGPRPALPAEVQSYDLDPRRRLAVKPGLTGLWQVSGRSDLSWEETVRLDLRYVDNWSLALDAAIVIRTVGAVVAHRGAY
jgi:exopolysaccharide biosynthesis polyprenyl glycosylphosphotransferase